MTTTTPQIFGQAKPVANIPTVLMTVANATQAQINLFVCNQGAALDTFSIELIPSGDSPDLSRYIAYNTPILANGVFSVAGVSLNTGDQVVVSTQNGNCSITGTGLQFTA